MGNKLSLLMAMLLSVCSLATAADGYPQLKSGATQQAEELAREEYYHTFEMKIDNLTNAEKQRLRSKFAYRENDATERKQNEEARHYHRLIEILENHISK